LFKQNWPVARRSFLIFWVEGLVKNSERSRYDVLKIAGGMDGYKEMRMVDITATPVFVRGRKGEAAVTGGRPGLSLISSLVVSAGKLLTEAWSTASRARQVAKYQEEPAAQFTSFHYRTVC
jgi:hypothetical protein